MKFSLSLSSRRLLIRQSVRWRNIAGRRARARVYTHTYIHVYDASVQVRETRIRTGPTSFSD